MKKVPVNIDSLNAEVVDYMSRSAEHLKIRRNYRKSLAGSLGIILAAVVLFVLALAAMTHSTDAIFLWTFIGASILVVGMIAIQAIRISRAMALYHVSVSELAGDYIESYIRGLCEGGED